MSIQMKCPNGGCTTVLTVKEEFAGKMIKCPSCGATAIVPSALAAVGAGGGSSPAPMNGAGPEASATPLPPEATPSTPQSGFMETVWALCDKNGLGRTQQMALLTGLAAMGLLLFGLLLTRCTEVRTDLSSNKVVTEWYWWLGFLTIVGGLMFFVTVLLVVFTVVSFAKMHVFLPYSFFASTAWGGGMFLFMALYMIIMALSGGDTGNTRIEWNNGIGTYFAILATVGVTGAFAFLSYPEVMKLLNKKPQVGA